MENGGGGGVAAENEVAPKRVRRPSVKLQQPYYEKPGNRKPQQKWNAFKKDLERAKKARNERNKKRVDDGVDGDEDVAIWNWRNFNGGNGDRDFNSKDKRKRVKPSTSSVKWQNQEIDGFGLINGGENEKLGDGKESDEEKGENSGENRVERNFEPESSNPSSPNGSIPDKRSSGDDEDDDGNNVGGGDHQRRSKQGFRNACDSNEDGEMRGLAGESDQDKSKGVKAWLHELGLGKYLNLFQLHEVDEEVLPFLTLDDLREMGVSAVGSRRKMYCSIQKLNKGLS